MKSLPKDLDDLILDRLVDNELSDQEYREVLRLVEEKPDGWRKLAVAFLESQAFENEMSCLHEIDGADSGAGSLLKDDPFETQEAGGYPVSHGPKRNGTDSQPSPVDPSFWKSFRRALPAIAACFAIAFTIALYVREIQNRGNSSDANSARGVAGDRPIDPRFIELVSNDPDGGVQTPVYNHQKFDPGSYAQDIDTLKPHLQEVVNRSGWSANEKTHVVPIKDGTGNRIIVPLKEINLKPTNFEDYQ